jgi:hypothetical protein
MKRIAIILPLIRNHESSAINNHLYNELFLEITSITYNEFDFYYIDFVDVINTGGINTPAYNKENEKIINFNQIDLIHFIDFDHLADNLNLDQKWENVFRTLEILNSTFQLKSINSYFSIKKMIDKNYLNEMIIFGGEFIGGKVLEVGQLAGLDVGDKMHIIKPLNGECSKGIYMFRNKLTLEIINSLRLISSRFIIQEYVKEVEKGEYSITIINSKIVASFIKDKKGNKVEFTLSQFEIDFVNNLINQLTCDLNIFRLDYLKCDNNYFKILEIEAVDPYFYNGFQKDKIVNEIINLYKEQTC